jgi:signal transduction histidine kinase/CheY-like chemotaxis protein
MSSSFAARSLFLACTILIVVHATLLAFHPHALVLSDVFNFFYPLLGVALCLLGASSEAIEARSLWLLFGTGLSLAAVGELALTYNDLANHLPVQTEAQKSDFFFFVYGIPVLLAICARGQDTGLKAFAWLDGMQAAIAAMLSYLQIFSVLPSHIHPAGISAIDLMYLNDAENWVLLGAVSLRYFSNPSPPRKRFYRSLARYLWVNGGLILLLGYLELKRGWQAGLQDAGWGLPYLTLMGSYVLQDNTTVNNEERSDRQQTVGLLIDNLSPVLFTLAITLMAVKISAQHPWFGFACISTAIAIYGVRTAILQIMYARSQDELTTAMLATEQASRAKGQFLANMSHEIRTPMNGILGMTELALSTPLSEEQRNFLLTVKSSADRLLTIINEILDYSKMEAGKTVLYAAPFDLPSVAGEALRGLAFLAHLKGLELALHIAPDVPAALTGDAVRLGQVLINLVGNAIKFTEHGEVCVTVTVSEVGNDRVGLNFSIRDTGIGIALDQQEGLFQAFQQAQTSGKRLYGGTGLGLALSRNIVNLMGGAIRLESLPGAGTTVTFTAYFTLAPATVEESPLSNPEALRGTSLLIVDDHATQRGLLGQLAQRWKMKFHACDSGASGLAELSRAAAAGDPYGLMLLDQQMPGMDGFAVLDCMRRNPLLQTPVIMMLTSEDQVNSAMRCRQMGVQNYLIKPILATDLAGAMLRSLGLLAAESPDALPAAVISVSPVSLRILLAEDNPVNQRVAMTMLGKMGHRVELAKNGREALERWRAGDFDLILMDVQMPEMTGVQAAQQIRREEAEGAHVPIVAMTASAMSEDRDRCMAAGMDNFVSKPISYKSVEHAINALRLSPVHSADESS